MSTQQALTERPEIMLIGFKGKFYLIEGEQYMQAMVMGNAPFPTPILCVHFSSPAQLAETFGDDVDVSAFWNVTGRAIKRLRDEGKLYEQDA